MGEIAKRKQVLLRAPVSPISIYKIDDLEQYGRCEVETRCFKTETRLWNSETEMRGNFGVPRLRRNTRLYISCFS